MDLNKDLMKDRSKKQIFRGDEEIKERFRSLLHEGINIATRNGHQMQIETVKLEETHMWARLECKSCGGVLYLDADRKWHTDKIFGVASMLNCDI